MNRKEFKRKYKTEIALISERQDVDMGVASDMLIQNARDYMAHEHIKYDFEGSNVANWEQITEDVQKMLEAEDGARAEAGI